MKVQWPIRAFRMAVVLALLLPGWWGPVASRPAAADVPASPASGTVLAVTADTMILSETADMNWGNWPWMEVGYDDLFGVQRPLLLFDLAPVPAGAQITEATLQVYYSLQYYPPADMTVTAYRVTSSWSEMGATWNNVGTAFAEAYGSALLDSTGDADWVSLDVTGLVQAWVNGTYPNYGLMLRGSESEPINYKYLDTKETPDSDHGARLAVTWQGSVAEHLVYLPLVLNNHQASPPLYPPINKIVYASGYTDEDPRYDIYVMNPDGTGQTRLTYGTTSSYKSPVWSPDGAKIAFTAITQAGEDILNEILIMNADGTGMAELFDLPGHHYHAAWSPYGTKIAFTSDLHNPGLETFNDIYVVSADGSGSPVNLTNTPNEHDVRPSWSPDGAKIAFESWIGENAEILVMNADGTARVNLTNSTYDDLAPRWSPDGQKIVFYRQIGTDSDPNWQIFVMNADGSGQVQLTSNSGQNFCPDWSPDGTKIAFHTYFEGTYADIYVVNADGTGVTNITNHQYAYASIEPDWR